MKEDDFKRSFQALSLLEDFAYTYRHGCLEVRSNSLSWWIHLKNGKFIYASHLAKKSIPYSLHRLKFELKNISSRAFLWIEGNSEKLLNLEFENSDSIQYFEHQIISWLVEQQYLTFNQAATLIEQLMRETIESFLSLTDGTAKINYKEPKIHTFRELEPRVVIEHCQTRLQSWKSVSPLISSPHQRPYIANQHVFCQPSNLDIISPRLKTKLVPILQGYSIRHIAALLQHDEFEIAKFLYPYIDNKSIVLRAPEPPFEHLYGAEPAHSLKTQGATTGVVKASNGIPSSVEKIDPASHVVIACVDDSPNTLNQIERFLGKENFLIFKFPEPVKATFQLRRIKPDIILLDLTMPKISGYELCRMLRNLPGFRKIPIVMVTGKKGVVDKARAKLVGATDYLEKPFTRDSLIDVISRNLP
ncbi:MAG: response regulator [Leptolyngbyaceae cyanobacterium]